MAGDPLVVLRQRSRPTGTPRRRRYASQVSPRPSRSTHGARRHTGGRCHDGYGTTGIGTVDVPGQGLHAQRRGCLASSRCPGRPGLADPCFTKSAQEPIGSEDAVSFDGRSSSPRTCSPAVTPTRRAASMTDTRKWWRRARWRSTSWRRSSRPAGSCSSRRSVGEAAELKDRGVIGPTRMHGSSSRSRC